MVEVASKTLERHGRLIVAADSSQLIGKVAPDEGVAFAGRPERQLLARDLTHTGGTTGGTTGAQG